MLPSYPYQMSKARNFSALDKYYLICLHLRQGISFAQIGREHQLHPKTLRRWLAKYKIHGLAGLQRKRRSDHGKRSSINEKMRELIEALILKKPPLSLAAVHRQAERIAQENQMNPPTYQLVWEIAQNLDPGLMMMAHQGRAAYDQAYELLYRHQAGRPNEIWQADHTPLDIALWDEKGQARKPWLSIIIDDYSRAICGYFLSFERPSALHTALALRQSIWRKTQQDWIVCGIPETLYTDHGSDFTSLHIETVCAELKIELVFSTVGKPRGRGKVERFFRSLTQLLLMDLPGYSPPKQR